MSKNRTSFIGVFTFLALATCCSAALITAAAQNSEPKNSDDLSNKNLKRIKRQFGGFGGNFNNGFGNNFNGNFGGRGGGRRRGQGPRPGNGNGFFPNNNNFGGFGGTGGFNGGGIGPSGNELIFSSGGGGGGDGGVGGGASAPAVTTPATFVSNGLNGNSNNINNAQLVFINNRPTIATMAPFTGRTTPSPQYASCFNSCATTSEYNPICGSDQELYFNEQKFNCARRCGADIQIVRRGSCSGLFPMMRG